MIFELYGPRYGEATGPGNINKLCTASRSSPSILPSLIGTLLYLLLSIPDAYGQGALAPDPLFLDDSIVEATIEAPWSTLVRERSTDDDLPATIRYDDPVSGPTEIAVTVHAHGNFRRDPKNCSFPPVTFGFPDSADGLFKGQRKLRFVNHCRKGSSRYEELVFREYIAYRLFNAITDLSYRARLFRITYVDTDGKMDSFTSHAFASEHESRMSYRNQLEFLNVEDVDVEELDGEYLNLTSVFQYLIGNTDFSPVASFAGEPCCHNYALYSGPGGKRYAIPYDFDMAGIVDAPYASPADQLGLRSVRQRRYRGRCINNDWLGSTLEKYREKRDEMYRLLESVDGQSTRSADQVHQYIDIFFETLDDPKAVERAFVGHCI